MKQRPPGPAEAASKVARSVGCAATLALMTSRSPEPGGRTRQVIQRNTYAVSSSPHRGKSHERLWFDRGASSDTPVLPTRRRCQRGRSRPNTGGFPPGGGGGVA